MTRDELCRWADDPAQEQSPVAAGVRDLLRDFAALRADALRLTQLVPAYERMRIDRDIAHAANEAYAAELARLRAQQAAPVPWDESHVRNRSDRRRPRDRSAGQSLAYPVARRRSGRGRA